MAENHTAPRVCMAKLNEYCQKGRLKLEYRDIDMTGPAHDRVFTVAAIIDGKQYGTGRGKSKKQAKDRAAEQAWEIIEQESQPEPASRPQLPAVSQSSEQLPVAAGNSLEVTSPPSVKCISLLNEYAAKHKVIVEYKLESKSGPSHMPVFTVAAIIDGKQYSTGTGKSKKEAKDRAAGLAWEIIEQESQMERSGAHTNNSTSSSFSDSQEVSDETSVKSIEAASEVASSESDSIVFQDSNAAPGRLADQLNGLHLKESSSSSMGSPKDPAVKPKRKETPLAPKFSKPIQKESEYTVNDRFLEGFCDIQKLGSGGYGNVFKAKHAIDGKIYAIKRVRLEKKTEKIIKEVKALAQLFHENIVRYFDCWTGEDIFSLEDSMNSISWEETKRYECLFIRMDYCEKGTLSNWICKERTNKSNDEVLMKFQQIVKGVEYIHRNNFIHRDLKPLNIFISKDDNIKIGDFGLVTTGVNDLSVERTQEKGTRLYMAPEQEWANYGKEVDIFALGLILFEMLYPCGTSHEKQKEFRNVRDGKFPKKICDEFSGEVQLIKKLVAKEPSKRPSADLILKLIDDQPYNSHTC